MAARQTARRLEVLALASEPTEHYVATALALVAQRVRIVASLRSLMLQVWEQIPDVIIVEGQVPQAEVSMVCRQVRQFFQTPILVVFEGASEGECITWLDSGADDLLALARSAPAELAARCKALLRRAQRQQRRDPAALRLHALGMQLDVPGRRLYVDGGRPLELSGGHTRLLALLFSYGGGVVPSAAVAEHMTGSVAAPVLKRIPALVQSVNRRLAVCLYPAPCVERVRGSGYRLALVGRAGDPDLVS